jgi:RNA polymerase sigma-70 factor (ECF subfamily)
MGDERGGPRVEGACVWWDGEREEAIDTGAVLALEASGSASQIAAGRADRSQAESSEVVLLAERALAGSHAAFDALVQHFQRPVRVYMSRLINDDDQARDLTQDVFSRAWGHLGQLRQPSHFRAWLFRIATNQAHSWLRHQRLIRVLSLDQLGRQHVDRDEASRASSPATVRELMPLSTGRGFEDRIAETELLDRALRSVPLAQRTCLILYLTYDFSVPEIAAQFDLSEPAVRKRLSRGMAVLRDAYRRESRERS